MFTGHTFKKENCFLLKVTEGERESEGAAKAQKHWRKMRSAERTEDIAVMDMLRGLCVFHIVP